MKPPFDCMIEMRMPARAFQLAQIAIHQRPDIGVDQSGRGALVFAKFRAHVVRAAQVAEPFERLRHAPSRLRACDTRAESKWRWTRRARAAIASSIAPIHSAAVSRAMVPSNQARSRTPKHIARGMMGTFGARRQVVKLRHDSAGRCGSRLQIRRWSPAPFARLCAPAARWWRRSSRESPRPCATRLPARVPPESRWPAIADSSAA